MHKTGLGSSAALVTSLVAALLPSVIRALSDRLTSRLSPARPGAVEEGTEVGQCSAWQLYNCVSDGEGGRRWDASVDPFRLPWGVELMMADVCDGSGSPGMAKRVLAWRGRKVAAVRDGGSGGDGAGPSVFAIHNGVEIT